MNSDEKPCLYESRPGLLFYNDKGKTLVRFELTDDELSRCPACGGTMYRIFEKDGYRMTAPCPGARVQHRLGLFNAAGIPSRFRNATFESFRLKGLPSDGVTIDTMFIRHVRSFRQGSRGVILEGGPGTGKTHLLCAAARYLTMEMNIPARYVDFSVLLSEIRGLYQMANQPQSEAGLIRDIVSVPVLFLDELGKGRDMRNDFEMRIIDEIINRRYNDDSLTTFFASNYKDRNSSGYKLFIENGIYDPSCKAWQDYAKKKCRTREEIARFTKNAQAVMASDHLEDRLDPRIVSRIFEMANPIVIEALDFRTSM